MFFGLFGLANKTLFGLLTLIFLHLDGHSISNTDVLTVGYLFCVLVFCPTMCLMLGKQGSIVLSVGTISLTTLYLGVGASSQELQDWLQLDMICYIN